MTENDEFWMRRALTLATEAAETDEVPVGAVLVREGEEIGMGFNRPVSSCDPTAHAELVALRDAAGQLENYRLPGSILYVTVEPCIMCVGAIVHARVERLVFGAIEPRAGAVVSQERLFDRAFLNHQVSYEGGILAGECRELMQHFFREKRNRC